ncbi:MAG: hypothetical protein LBU90_10590 [Bacteroidales bacterium]|jgi:hypothetical protein|nr:hypothetical protein [Bacteroidales bacterium]
MATKKIDVVKQQKDELLKLILSKSGYSRAKLHAVAEHNYVAANLDMITAAERKRFNKLVF